MDFDYYKHNVYTILTPGGAVHCHSCKIEIMHSIFEYNKGVALLGNRAQIRIKSCQFSYNNAEELGGALHATLRTRIEISGTTSFENN